MGEMTNVFCKRRNVIRNQPYTISACAPLSNLSTIVTHTVIVISTDLGLNGQTPQILRERTSPTAAFLLQAEAEESLDQELGSSQTFHIKSLNTERL